MNEKRAALCKRCAIERRIDVPYKHYLLCPKAPNPMTYSCVSRINPLYLPKGCHFKLEHLMLWDEGCNV